MAYGVWQVGRGVLNGAALFYTLKFFVFNYYTLYLFLGLWVGLHAPNCLPKLVRVAAWVNGIYGITFLLALRHVEAYIPGSDVPLFSAPTGQVVVILGLAVLRARPPVGLVHFGAQHHRHAGVAGARRVGGPGVRHLRLGLLTGRLGRVIAIGVAGLAVLGIVELTGINLPGRNSESISLSENLARVIAPIDLELAAQLSPAAKFHAGTAEWRELWWEQIWLSVHSTAMLEAFGHGYGFDLFGLAPDEVRAGQEKWEVRTPHSLFYYALGYTGWVGVALFGALQWAIVRLLWRAFRVSGQPAGIAWWVMGITMASFQEGLETPFHAIPFYLLVGLTIAPALRSKTEWEELPAQAPLASVAGR